MHVHVYADTHADRHAPFSDFFPSLMRFHPCARTLASKRARTCALTLTFTHALADKLRSFFLSSGVRWLMDCSWDDDNCCSLVKKKSSENL